VDVQPLPTPTITQVGFTLTSDITGAAYQWYFNSTIMNGETAVSTIATANGNYSVEVTSVDGCSGVSPDLNVTSIGVNQLTIDNGQWTIYPNPATTQLQVSSSKFQVGEVMIYNVTGQLVLQTKVSNQQSTINISDLAKGIYTIKMMSNSDVNVLRFIKE